MTTETPAPQNLDEAQFPTGDPVGIDANAPAPAAAEAITNAIVINERPSDPLGAQTMISIKDQLITDHGRLTSIAHEMVSGARRDLDDLANAMEKSSRIVAKAIEDHALVCREVMLAGGEIVTRVRNVADMFPKAPPKE